MDGLFLLVSVAAVLVLTEGYGLLVAALARGDALGLVWMILIREAALPLTVITWLPIVLTTGGRGGVGVGGSPERGFPEDCRIRRSDTHAPKRQCARHEQNVQFQFHILFLPALLEVAETVLYSVPGNGGPRHDEPRGFPRERFTRLASFRFLRRVPSQRPPQHALQLSTTCTTDVERLRAAYFARKRDAAAGIDSETWRHYEETLETNLQDLSGRLHRERTGRSRSGECSSRRR